jgi:hypothetical protein
MENGFQYHIKMKYAVSTGGFNLTFVVGFASEDELRIGRKSGVGGFKLAYKATLVDGTLVVVRFLHLQS